jgi:NAD(P)-dependent dehydrogenase (short-subunit alcohol dehydrogenase family)
MAQRSIFITGGASGIGRAVAERFAREGWFVGLADVNEAGMRETAAKLPDGASAIYMLDVRSRDQWADALADFWEKAGGRLDVLFNNAGIGRGGPLEQMNREDVDAVLAININGVVHGAEAGFPYLAKTPGSVLLNTASAAGIIGAAGMSIYCATKFAVRGFTESLDIEWGAHGIKVACLMPSFIDTAILDGIALGTNRQTREVVADLGMEIAPVSVAADAAWAAVHGDEVRIRVGRDAKRMWHMARLFPGFLRKTMKKRAAETAARLAG